MKHASIGFLRHKIGIIGMFSELVNRIYLMSSTMKINRSYDVIRDETKQRRAGPQSFFPQLVIDSIRKGLIPEGKGSLEIPSLRVRQQIKCGA